MSEDINSEKYVKSLFDEMAKTYGLVNLISSLGFAYLWRKKAVLHLPKSSTVADIMTGGGECLQHLKKHLGNDVHVDLVDISSEMCHNANEQIKRNQYTNTKIFNCSALEIPIPDNYYDAIVSTFGMKTLSDDDLNKLAKETKRIIKNNGVLSILEFSLPSNKFIQFFFKLYVKYYVPTLGFLLLGNPENYRMLWQYTEKFMNCEKLIPIFQKEGFTVEYKNYFFGSATILIGRL